MFDHLLFPTDGSSGADRVLDHVVDIATTHDATLHLLYVSPDDPKRRPQAGDAEHFLSDAVARAEGSGLDTVDEIRHGEPYEEIVAYANDTDVDLVVMPTHGRTGLSRLVLGSTTERVVRGSTVPVLTVSPDADGGLSYPYERLLSPTDGSTCATTAHRLGSELAVETDADLHVLSVVDVATLAADVRGPQLIDALEENADRFVEEADAIATEIGVGSVTSAVEHGVSISGEIRAYVEDHDIDLVVIGTHGRSGFDRFMLGSVAEKLLRRSPVPVLTVRERDEA
ncbi:universal stress protein [Haloferax sp. YSSS75]|uniref:universal stress protein n=1 Tax=Haloferax sp. YSSS75 TaxID=3388564 RepID=UPI00398D55DC